MGFEHSEKIIFGLESASADHEEWSSIFGLESASADHEEWSSIFGLESASADHEEWSSIHLIMKNTEFTLKDAGYWHHYKMPSMWL